jgi:hypothetical protein
MRSLALRLVALALPIGLILMPPAPTAAQQPRRGGVLRVAHIGEPPTLDQLQHGVRFRPGSSLPLGPTTDLAGMV